MKTEKGYSALARRIEKDIKSRLKAINGVKCNHCDHAKWVREKQGKPSREKLLPRPFPALGFLKPKRKKRGAALAFFLTLRAFLCLCRLVWYAFRVLGYAAYAVWRVIRIPLLLPAAIKRGLRAYFARRLDMYKCRKAIRAKMVQISNHSCRFCGEQNAQMIHAEGDIKCDRHCFYLAEELAAAKVRYYTLKYKIGPDLECGGHCQNMFLEIKDAEQKVYHYATFKFKLD